MIYLHLMYFSFFNGIVTLCFVLPRGLGGRATANAALPLLQSSYRVRVVADRCLFIVAACCCLLWKGSSSIMRRRNLSIYSYAAAAVLMLLRFDLVSHRLAPFLLPCVFSPWVLLALLRTVLAFITLFWDKVLRISLGLFFAVVVKLVIFSLSFGFTNSLFVCFSLFPLPSSVLNRCFSFVSFV